MRTLTSLALVATSALLLAAPALAAERTEAGGTASPIQLALFSPVQIVAPEKSVGGVRLDLLYGKNADVTGLDWGLVNHTTGSELAWQLGLVGFVEKDFTGFQDNGVNIARGAMLGVQWGAYNQSESMRGVAIGWVNVTHHMSGLQLGLVNVTDTMRGLQIGVGNVIHQGKIPFLPIVNWSF